MRQTQNDTAGQHLDAHGRTSILLAALLVLLLILCGALLFDLSGTAPVSEQQRFSGDHDLEALPVRSNPFEVEGLSTNAIEEGEGASLETAASTSITDVNSSFLYQGGEVQTNSTAYLIFWAPSNLGLTFDPEYQRLLDQYMTDVVTAGAQAPSTINVVRQYASLKGRIKRIGYGGSFNDASPVSGASCKVTAIPACVTDNEVRRFLSNFVRSHGLPTGLRASYSVVLPQGLATCAFGGECSYTHFCGYHDVTPVDAESAALSKQIVYANIPYNGETNGWYSCNSRQAPNHVGADPTISLLSHEWAEMITDPIPYEDTAWAGGDGEVADTCAWQFGDPLGYTANGEQFNQLINGHPYYVQMMWSNQVRGCVTAPNPPERLRAVIHLRGRVFDAGEPIHLSASGSRSVYTLWHVDGGYVGMGKQKVVTIGRPGKHKVSLLMTMPNGNFVGRTIQLLIRPAQA